MSICSHETMTNSHGAGVVAQLVDTLRLWRDRWNQRRELARWTEREMHDVGLSWADIVREAEKPFWRA